MYCIRIAQKCRNIALIVPSRHGSLSGNTARKGRADDVFMQIVHRRSLDSEVFSCRYACSLVYKSFCLRIRIYGADRRAYTCHRTAGKTAHDVLHRELVIRLDGDIAARRNSCPVSDLRKCSFLACSVRCLGRKGHTELVLYFQKRICTVRTDRFRRVFVNFRKFVIHPAVEADGFPVCACLAGKCLLVFLRHGTADAVDRNTA